MKVAHIFSIEVGCFQALAYNPPDEVIMASKSHVFDSFGCAIQKGAIYRCSHCVRSAEPA